MEIIVIALSCLAGIAVYIAGVEWCKRKLRPKNAKPGDPVFISPLLRGFWIIAAFLFVVGTVSFIDTMDKLRLSASEKMELIVN